MNDLDDRLGINGVDLARSYIQFHKAGFDIEPSNGNNSFYTVGLLKFTEKVVNPDNNHAFKTAFNTAKKQKINGDPKVFAQSVKALYEGIMSKSSNKHKNNLPLSNEKMSQIDPEFVRYENMVISVISEYLKENPEEMPQPTYTKICKEKGLKPKDVVHNVLSNIVSVITDEVVKGKHKTKSDIIDSYKAYNYILKD